MKRFTTANAAFSVALSDDTGCIVIVEMRGKVPRVMGSLTHEQSVTFADAVMRWMPRALRREEKAQDAPH